MCKYIITFADLTYLTFVSCQVIVELISKQSVQRQLSAHYGAVTHRFTLHHKNLCSMSIQLPSQAKTLWQLWPRWCLLLKGKFTSICTKPELCFESMQQYTYLGRRSFILLHFCSDFFWNCRAVASPAKALIPAIRPLLSAALHNILQTLSRVFPHAELGLKRKRDYGNKQFLCIVFFSFTKSNVTSVLWCKSCLI